MEGTYAMRADAVQVLGSSVPHMLTESVLGVSVGNRTPHQFVADGLGNDGGRRDGCAFRVSPDDGAVVWGTGTQRKAVDQKRVATCLKILQERPEQTEVGDVQTITVDRPVGSDAHHHTVCVSPYTGGKLRAPGPTDALGVVERRQRTADGWG